MGGSGGNSGKIQYPSYLQDWHRELLYNTSLPDVDAGDDLHSIAFGSPGIFGASNNPYTGVAAFDPTTNLDTTQDELGELEAMVDSLVIATRLGSLNQSHRDLLKLDLAQGYNRIGATLGAANAIIGTVYPTALAILETDFTAKVHQATISYEVEQTRNKAQAIQLRIDFMRNRIAAFMDQTRQDVEYNVEEVLWDVNAYLRLLSAIGAISGVATTTSRSGNSSDLKSVLGGMASGASVGMAAMPGPWGAAAGAGIGGLLGILGA